MEVTKATLRSYKACEIWLERYELEYNDLIYSLSGVKAVSYENKAGGNSLSKDMQKAIASDTLVEFEKKHKKKKEYCENVIYLCKEWIKNVPEQHQDLMKSYIFDGKTQLEVADEYNFSRQYIYKLIDTITARASQKEFLLENKT